MTDILAALPLEQIVLAVIAAVSAVVGAVARRYLAAKAAAQVQQLFADVMTRAARSVLVELGDPPREMGEAAARPGVPVSHVQAVVAYAQRHAPAALRAVGADKDIDGLRARAKVALSEELGLDRMRF